MNNLPEIIIPDEVKCIIDNLENAGHEAYAVGGCIRDSLLSKEPKDWDICTSALPEQTIKCFKDLKGSHIIETGLQHGTVTLLLNHNPFEITTYRVDGKYTDNRRPEKVEFVNVLKRDLARRDFTINAMAYNPKTGLADYYGGCRDLAQRRIKCVGNPNRRFREDALRIMRALRFAAELGFSIESDTSAAMRDNRKLLHNIAAERIAAELNKLLMGDKIHALFSEHISVIGEIIPEISSIAGFGRILSGLENAPKEIAVRLAILFCEIGDPQLSSDMAGARLSRLRYDNDTLTTVTQLLLYRNCEIGGRQHIKRWLNKIGEKRFWQLIEVKKAEAMAQAEHIRQKKLDAVNEISAVADEIISKGQCYSLKHLALKGDDLISAGIPQGIGIGIILDKLIDMVIDEKVANDKDILLEISKTELGKYT